MSHRPPSITQKLLRTFSVFLTGVVVGVAGFVLWAERAGVLVASPFSILILPLGLLIGLFIAVLLPLIGEMLQALHRINVSNQELEDHRWRDTLDQ